MPDCKLKERADRDTLKCSPNRDCLAKVNSGQCEQHNPILSPDSTVVVSGGAGATIDHSDCTAFLESSVHQSNYQRFGGFYGLLQETESASKKILKVFYLEPHDHLLNSIGVKGDNRQVVRTFVEESLEDLDGETEEERFRQLIRLFQDLLEQFLPEVPPGDLLFD
ncbi:MAG: hypothetical protein HQL48_10825 [Gammaproteobacteria bacterium]|nr:hypothetical protein [Gammaproteobacteria bacterium]